MPGTFAIGISARTPRHVTLRIAAPGARFFLPEPREWTLRVGDRTERGGLAEHAVLAFDGLQPDTEYALHVDGVSPYSFCTAPCAGLVDIASFGAREDADDNCPAISAAIAATSPGGTVFVPPGRWLTAPIFLRSHLTLHLARDAELAAVADRDRFAILPARRADGRMLGSWEGLPATAYAALVTAIDCRSIAITGSGTLDGGGDRGDWWSWPKETRGGARRARTIYLNGCEDVTLAGVTVQNSPSWTVHPVYCQLLTASALTILNDPDSPNTDGLNPECLRGRAHRGRALLGRRRLHRHQGRQARRRRRQVTWPQRGGSPSGTA
jgi:polygalacturonase